MDKENILSRVDHTLLEQIATWEQIEKLCGEGMEYGTASVCIPPCYVKQAKNFVGNRLTICTVIGFPSSNMATAVKVFETEDAMKNDADEIDMTISIGLVRAGHYDQALDGVRQIKTTCDGRYLKVIIETYLLTEGEKRETCCIVTEPGADLIKTSTEFSVAGTAPEDVALMGKYSGPEMKAKAAGGVASIKDAERFIKLGADRLGTGGLIPWAENLNQAL